MNVGELRERLTGLADDLPVTAMVDGEERTVSGSGPVRAIRWNPGAEAGISQPDDAGEEYLAGYRLAVA